MDYPTTTVEFNGIPGTFQGVLYWTVFMLILSAALIEMSGLKPIATECCKLALMLLKLIGAAISALTHALSPKKKTRNTNP